jgi:hypothetical protein
MRLVNYLYSIVNGNAGLNSKSQSLIQLSANAIYKSMNKKLTAGINIISFNSRKQLIANRQLLSYITRVKDQEVKPLIANKNVLYFDEGSYYKVQTRAGIAVVLTSGVEGTGYMPYDVMNFHKDLSISPSDYKEIEGVEKLLAYLLRDKTGYFVRTSYRKTEIKAMLGSVGIKPGWFQIKNDGKSNKFYMLDNGGIYSEYQIEAHRAALNTINYFKEGYTKDSVFIIDGREYKLDDNGHLHVPEGVVCVMETIKRIK